MSVKTCTREELFNECVEFHGHECGGLKIGFIASVYAMKLLGLLKEENGKMKIERSYDEEIVCLSENDACGIDAIEYITGCTGGKGNLKFDIVGKQAFNFYNRNTDKSFRIVLKELSVSKDEMMKMHEEEVFKITPVHYPLPKKAEIYKSIICDICKEKTAAPYIYKIEGKSVCQYCKENI